MKRYSTNIILILTVVSITSCSKLIKIDQPINFITSDKVFTDSGSAISALNGLYIRMDGNASFATNLVNVTAALSSDELTYSGTAPEYIEFANNTLDAANSYVSSLWAYNIIYQANTIIENASQSKTLSQSLKAKMTGTAKFIRAFYYFYLVNMFGDVPLVTSPDYTKTALIPRTSTDSIYNQIIADLNDAASKLTSEYDGNFNKGGITSWAAKALLARVYLYQKEWQEAFAQSNAIINSGIFHLEPNLDNVFLANSSGAIWQLAPLDGQGFTSEGNIFIPNTGLIPQYQISDTLLHSFEPGDKRLTQWIGETNVNGLDYFFPYKYKVRSGTGTSTEYYMIFRLGEQYLIRAEAEAELGQIQDALEDLDSIRHRAGLPLYSNNGFNYSETDVLQLVEKERQHELFVEWGHRWFDLKRTGQVNAVLSSIKAGWKPAASLYPIPNTQILRNSNLKQNPGY